MDKGYRSIRMRIMTSTLAAMIIALVSSCAFFYLAIKTGFLVDDHKNELARDISINTGSRIRHASTHAVISKYDFFYRNFGVSVSWQLMVIIFIAGILVFMISFFFLTRSMTAYISDIEAGVTKMAEGDFSAEISIRDADDELTSIAKKINEMSARAGEMQRHTKEAEDVKNSLITDVAHDLRTPLTSVIGYIDLVNTADTLSDETKKQYLEIAYSKAVKLNHLIDDLFSFTKLSLDEIPMTFSRIDVISLLEQAVDELFPVFEENGMTCRFKKDTDSFMMDADGEQLIRVFDNLFSNAIRYGKDGKIIKVETVTGKDKIQIHVINYGGIIPADKLPYIFEKFYKTDTSRGASEGTGLGLAIAKTIVEKHGGTIAADSSLDGTDFCITFSGCKNQ